MISTYDWLLLVFADKGLDNDIRERITSDKDSEMIIADKYRINFYGKSHIAEIRALDKDRSVVPVRIAYRALTQMLNKDFDNIRDGDIKNMISG